MNISYCAPAALSPQGGDIMHWAVWLSRIHRPLSTNVLHRLKTY